MKEVTAIEVYEDTQYKDKLTYIACMVFYKGDQIIGAPYAGRLIGAQTIQSIKEAFIDKCPGNNYQLQARYEKPANSKLVGFEYADRKSHPNFGYVLPYIKPIYWSFEDALK